jgi:hypothetical protein
MDIRGRREGLWRIVISCLTFALAGKVGVSGRDLARPRPPGEAGVEQANRRPCPARRETARGPLRRLRHRRGAISLCRPSRRKAPSCAGHFQSQARNLRIDLGGNDHQRRQCNMVVRRHDRRSRARRSARAIRRAHREDRLHRTCADRAPRRTTRQSYRQSRGAEVEGIFGNVTNAGRNTPDASAAPYSPQVANASLKARSPGAPFSMAMMARRWLT